jgi:hypothetical protein
METSNRRRHYFRRYLCGGSAVTNHPQLWPEGETFIREVLIPTKYEPLPVLVTYIVPPFDAVVATWQNTDPEKAYSLFRQFIVDWDQQDKLTDDILISFGDVSRHRQSNF